MTTPPLDLPALKETANAAHGVLPAPWVVMNDNNVVSVVERSQRDGSIIAGGEVAEAQTTQFRDHIAVFDPPTVLALLDRVEAAGASMDRARVEVMAGEHAESCARRYAWAPDNCTCWKNAMLTALGWSNQ